jgi:hypothetical protein
LLTFGAMPKVRKKKISPAKRLKKEKYYYRAK